MSSGNRGPKENHLSIKKNSSSLASKGSKQPSTSHSSSQKPLNQTSSSMGSTNPTVLRTSSQRTSKATYISTSNSTSNTSRSSNTESFDHLAHTNIDLISVSAWTSLHESPHHQQDFSYQSYDNLQRSACPYHISMIGSADHVSSLGYGLLPFERWLDEYLRDGGSLALQFGEQLRLDCTCIAMQDDLVQGNTNGA